MSSVASNPVINSGVRVFRTSAHGALDVGFRKRELDGPGLHSRNQGHGREGRGDGGKQREADEEGAQEFQSLLARASTARAGRCFNETNRSRGVSRQSRPGRSPVGISRIRRRPRGPGFPRATGPPGGTVPGSGLRDNSRAKPITTRPFDPASGCRRAPVWPDFSRKESRGPEPSRLGRAEMRGVYVGPGYTAAASPRKPKFGIQDRVVIHGPVSEAGEVLAAFDWLLLPSHDESCVSSYWRPGPPAYPPSRRRLAWRPTPRLRQNGGHEPDRVQQLATATCSDLADPEGVKARVERAKAVASSEYGSARFGREWTAFVIEQALLLERLGPVQDPPIFFAPAQDKASIVAQASSAGTATGKGGWHARCLAGMGGIDPHFVVTAESVAFPRLWKGAGMSVITTQNSDGVPPETRSCEYLSAFREQIRRLRDGGMPDVRSKS